MKRGRDWPIFVKKPTAVLSRLLYSIFFSLYLSVMQQKSTNSQLGVNAQKATHGQSSNWSEWN